MSLFAFEEALESGRRLLPWTVVGEREVRGMTADEIVLVAFASLAALVAGILAAARFGGLT